MPGVPRTRNPASVPTFNRAAPLWILNDTVVSPAAAAAAAGLVPLPTLVASAPAAAASASRAAQTVFSAPRVNVSLRPLP